MKKSSLILIFSLLSLSLIFNLLNAQDTFPGTGINVQQASGQVENITNALNTPGGVNAQWNYIGGELRKMILKNSFAITIDSFLQSISIVFFILFGMQYILSPALLFTVALWFYFLFTFRSIFRNFASFSKWISSIIAFLIVVIMAHVKIFEIQVNFLMSLLFGNNSWVLKLILWLVVIFAPVAIYYFIKVYGKTFAANRKKMKDELNRMKLELAGKSGEEFAKALSKFSN